MSVTLADLIRAVATTSRIDRLAGYSEDAWGKVLIRHLGKNGPGNLTLDQIIEEYLQELLGPEATLASVQEILDLQAAVRTGDDA